MQPEHIGHAHGGIVLTVQVCTRSPSTVSIVCKSRQRQELEAIIGASRTQLRIASPREHPPRLHPRRPHSPRPHRAESPHIGYACKWRPCFYCAHSARIARPVPIPVAPRCSSPSPRTPRLALRTAYVLSQTKDADLLARQYCAESIIRNSPAKPTRPRRAQLKRLVRRDDKHYAAELAQIHVCAPGERHLPPSHIHLHLPKLVSQSQSQDEPWCACKHRITQRLTDTEPGPKAGNSTQQDQVSSAGEKNQERARVCVPT